MKGDEFTIIVEDINEKFDILIEGQSLLKERLDRHTDDEKKGFKEVRSNLLNLKKNVWEIRKELDSHRESTELHAVKRKKKAS
jgi:hypothetical protein